MEGEAEEAAPLVSEEEAAAVAAALELAAQDVNAGLKAEVLRLETTIKLALGTIAVAESKASMEAAVLQALIKVNQNSNGLGRGILEDSCLATK